MFVIIKKIPTSITLEHIENFVSPVIKEEFLTKHGAIKAIQIIELLDRRGNAIERHGLVRVGPDSIVKQLIKSLNRCTMNNSRFIVDEYFNRHWRNERRATKSAQPMLANNKRKLDRRRLGLKKITVAEKLDFETQSE